MRRRGQVPHKLCRTFIPYLKVKADGIQNAERGFPVTVRINGIGHSLVDALIVEQLRGRASQRDSASFHDVRALRDF